jgi:hypothetical protein
VSTTSAAVDVQAELVAASRERVASQLSSRERLTHGASAVAFAIAATTLAFTAPSSSGKAWLLASLFVVTVAVASRIELEVGSGFAAPVELAVIPMLFALPAGWVPAAVALGLVAGQVPSYLRGRVPSERMVVAVGKCVLHRCPGDRLHALL